MATLGFMDNDGVDLGNKYVTKDYVMTWYPNLPSNMGAPQLWGWGDNGNGALGDSSTTNRSSPVQTITGGTNWKYVAGGDDLTAAVKTDGTLWCWGKNNVGQLGDGTLTWRSSPIQTIAGGVNWKQVSCGYRHMAAIKTDGTLWGWGYNYYGQLGDNTTTNKSSPVQTVAGGTNWAQVSSSRLITAAIKTDGSLWSCGYNAYGTIGDNSTTNKSSPVQTIAGGTNWKFIGCGYVHAAAIKTDGTLWLWGWNNDGQLGDNTTTNRSSPIQSIAGGTNWKWVAGGAYHTAAIKTDGTLWVWGQNSYGQLGNNTLVPKSSPVQTVAGGTNWKIIASGAYHTVAAIKTDGTLWVWGLNNTGQLGDNTTTNKSTPIQTIAGGTNWKSAAGGYRHILALTEASGW